MTMRSFDWGEEQNDAGVVPTNESPRACALVGSCWNGLRVAQSVDYQLDFRRAWRCAERSGDASSQVDRASSLHERTGSLDETRRLDRGRARLIIKPFLLRLKLKVPGRRLYIFFMTCNDRMRSSCSKMLIWPSTAATRQ